MKRIVLLLISSAILFTFAGCNNGGNDDSSDINSEPSSQVSGESSVEEKTKLESCFGELYDNDEYYISADISVVSNSSPGDVSRYELKIAADNRNNRAMLHMKPSQGDTVHIIIRDGFSYNINDEQGTCSQQSFTEDVSAFTSSYTTELYLGITKNLELLKSGTKEVSSEGSGGRKELYYETYRLSSGEGSGDSISITYYFDGDIPKQEVMETAAGRTTFVFKEISTEIKDKTVFDVTAYTDAGSSPDIT